MLPQCIGAEVVLTDYCGSVFGVAARSTPLVGGLLTPDVAVVPRTAAFLIRVRPSTMGAFASLRAVSRLEWLPDQLCPVAFRVARADECAFEIAKLAGRWSFDEPLGLVQYVWENRYSVRIESVRPIPPRISLLFSEAVSHLRAALDNVVWFMVEQAQRSTTWSGSWWSRRRAHPRRG